MNSRAVTPDQHVQIASDAVNENSMRFIFEVLGATRFMTRCIICKKSIKLTEEPKLKFTRLGGNYLHSKCYIHIHTINNLGNYA